MATEVKETQAFSASGRIASIDALRGLTILVMIFVNNVAGVANAPRWMQHYYALNPDGSKDWLANGMTFVDLVFPAFLFIVGMAIPFALGRRLERGEALWKTWRHIIVRTLGLLITGVFMVNMHVSAQDFAAPIPKALWDFLAFLFIIFVWNMPPKEPGRKRTIYLSLRGVGIAGLVALAAIYRRIDGSGNEIMMQTSWWGILGLIGWAYLAASVVYMLLRNNVAGHVGAMALLYCLFLADNAVDLAALTNGLVGIGSQIGSHGALVVSGVALGIMLRPDSGLQGHWPRLRWAILYGAALFTAAMLIYPLHEYEAVSKMFRINKNIATPTWCLMSAAYTIWVWVVIYWLMDMQGWKKWAVLLRPAGENPLLAYILAPMIVALMELVAVAGWFHGLGSNFWPGLIRAVVWAFAITWLAGGLKSWGVRLRL